MAWWARVAQGCFWFSFSTVALPCRVSAAAMLNSRSRSLLGSQRRATLLRRASSCIQAVISAASVTTAHQMRFCARVCSGRLRSPAMLADRQPTRAVPTLDLCPVTGRAQLSYRRAAELFARASTPLAALGQAHGWTLHQLRHSALTHDAENGTNTPMLLARSRHASMRSLERYARPGPEALARHAAATDPARRRQQ